MAAILAALVIGCLVYLLHDARLAAGEHTELAPSRCAALMAQTTPDDTETQIRVISEWLDGGCGSDDGRRQMTFELTDRIRHKHSYLRCEAQGGRGTEQLYGAGGVLYIDGELAERFYCNLPPFDHRVDSDGAFHEKYAQGGDWNFSER